MSQDMFNREMDATIGEQVERRLGDVERALQKIEEGTYGLSDESGEPIPRGRLEAVPEAITDRRGAAALRAGSAARRSRPISLAAYNLAMDHRSSTRSTKRQESPSSAATSKGRGQNPGMSP